MKQFRVEGGTAKFGPGQTLGLTLEQIKSRAHALDPVEPRGDAMDGGGIVNVKTAIEFKAGETVWLDAVPRNLAAMLRDVSAPAASTSEPPRPAEPNRAAKPHGRR